MEFLQLAGQPHREVGIKNFAELNRRFRKGKSLRLNNFKHIAGIVN